MKTHLTLKSLNVKTGPIPVSTTSALSCPPSCAFFKMCYGSTGPIKIHWDKVTDGDRGENWDDFCSRITALPRQQLWRHNQVGDLYGNGDKIDTRKLAQLVKANNGKRGFTYTHKPVIGTSKLATANRKAVATANRNGFTINLSGNNLEHADKLADLAIAPVVVVLPSTATSNTVTPSGRKVIVCPATQREGVNCATCQLCSKVNRSVIVGFPAHGTYKRKTDAIVTA